MLKQLPALGSQRASKLPTQDSESSRPIQRRIGWLLIVYFIWIVAVNIWAAFSPNASQATGYLFEFAAFAITTAMLVVARASPGRFRIDRLTAVLLVLFATILRLQRPEEVGSAPDPTYFAFAIVAVVIAAVVIRSRGTDRKWAGTSPGWLALGLVSGTALGLFMQSLASLFYRGEATPAASYPITIGALVLTFIYTMGHTAILEEPIGRGFLWGYFELRGWRPVRIWLLQAALFWLGHLRLVDSPVTFWLALPLGGLMLGWFSWHSRSVSAGLLAHAAYNTLGAFY